MIFDVGGEAGKLLFFMASLVGCGIWSMLYLLFVSHYFLVVVIDSSAGHDEVQFPSEGVLDWWWKPFFCLWLLAFWVIAGGVFLSPFLAFSPLAFVIGLGLLLWFMYPVSVMSTLYAQNWLFFLHPIILWRMLRHYKPFAYVHLVTLLSVSACAGLLFATFRHSFAWSAAVAFVLPAVLLFYARNWGRFAWLSLNFVPRKIKTSRSQDVQPREKETADEDVPIMAVQEVDETAEGIREGLPPAYPHAIQAGVPASPEGIVAGSPPRPFIEEEEDEWAVDKSPYKIVGEADRPNIQAAVPAPASPPSGRKPIVEEVDEWATDENPYGFAEHTPEAEAEPQSEANKAVPSSQYFDERAKKEKAATAKRQRDTEQNFMPTLSKKTPTFSVALLEGVGTFMLDPRTLGVFVNLVVLTAVELLLLLLVVRLWPRLD